TQDNIVDILERIMLPRVDAALKNKDMGLELTAKAKETLAKRGFDPVLGARPLRRTVQREIEDQVSEKILYGDLQPGHIVGVDVEGEGDTAKFTFRGEPKPGSLPDTPPVGVAGTGEASGGGTAIAE